MEEEDTENAVKIQNTFHHFRAFSELSGKDNKGGYIKAKVSVPSNAAKITISCITLVKTPHVNFLFVSPKQRIVKPKKIPPQDLHGFTASQDNKVILFKNLLGEFEICPPNYWDGLTSAQILGCDFWNGQELVLGPNALQLTVCKALQKVNSEISRNEEFDGEMEKVRLKVEFELANDRNVQVKYLNASLEVLPVDEQKCKVGFSSVLFDKQKYCLEIGEILVGRKICNYSGDHILLINFRKVKITRDKSLRLMLVTENTNKVFTEFEILNPDMVKFKISVHDFPVQEGILFAFIEDPDLNWVFETWMAEESQKLRILQHDENCQYCDCTQLDFKSQVVRKRKISSVSSTSKKSKESTTSDDAADSPCQDMDFLNLENFEGLLGHDGFEKPQPNNTSIWKFFKYFGFLALLSIMSFVFLVKY